MVRTLSRRDREILERFASDGPKEGGFKKVLKITGYVALGIVGLIVLGIAGNFVSNMIQRRR